MEQKPFSEFIDDFINTLVREMHPEPLSEEDGKRLRDVVEQIVQKRILSTVVDNLTEEMFNELMTEMTGELTEEEEVTLFAKYAERIPNFSPILSDNLRTLYQEMSEDARDLDELLQKESNGSN